MIKRMTSMMQTMEVSFLKNVSELSLKDQLQGEKLGHSDGAQNTAAAPLCQLDVVRAG